MLILNQPFSPDWDGRPPGMSHDDWPIWLVFRWLKISEDSCYYYNVRIGEPVPAPAGAPDGYRRQWELSSLFRIDALGINRASVNLYEIKQLATPQDLWQLITYRDLLVTEMFSLVPISPWLIAETFVEGTLAQAHNLSVKTWYPPRKA